MPMLSWQDLRTWWLKFDAATVAELADTMPVVSEGQMERVKREYEGERRQARWRDNTNAMRERRRNGR